MAVLPNALGLWVDPGKFRKSAGEPLQPLRAGLLVVVLHAAPGLQNFIGTHGGVTYKNQFVVFVVFSDDVPGRKLLCKTPPVVFPHEVIHTIVEVVKLKVFEFGFGGAKEFLNPRDVVVHGTAHIHQQQHFDVVVAFGNHLDVEITCVGSGAANRVV